MTSPAAKVITADTQATVGHSCPKCSLLYTVRMFGGGPGAEEQSLASATECCDHRCPDCNEPRTMGYTHCGPCMAKRRKEREVEQYAAAPKETIAAYLEREPDGMVTDGDTFWTVDSYVDDSVWLNHPRVWFCEPTRGIELDASDVVSSWVDDSFEDAEEHLGMTELQQLLDGWCAKQTVCSWHQGKTALEPSEIERLAAEGAKADEQEDAEAATEAEAS